MVGHGQLIKTDWEGAAGGDHVLDLKVQGSDGEAELLHDAGKLPGREQRLLHTDHKPREQEEVVHCSIFLHFSYRRRLQTDLLAPVHTKYPLL